ncbi:MAG TPA: sodium/proline symporter [Acidobacteriota bacterium]|nr:sodium/proline symporter [Acidobacteriota bacterium]
MSHEAAVLVTLVLYKIVLIIIGLLSQRRTKDSLDFFLGGRQLGPLVAAVSASASSSSAWTLLGVSGAAYLWGLSSLWLFPACVGGFLLNWYGVAPALQRYSREVDAMTVTEVLAGRPGQPLHRTLSVTASLIILVSLGAYVASQFLSAGKTFYETFNLPISSSILIGGGIVVLYTLLGGFWAVSITDTLQGLMMAATAILLPVAALIAVGGPGGLWEGIGQVGPDYMSLTRNLGPAAALGLIWGYLGIGLGYPGQPHVVNRFMALREGRASLVSARRIAIAWALVVYSGMLLLGLCGRLLYPALSDPEVVFVSATNELFPPVLAGIMVAAVLSAIMSTADSQLLVAASSVTHDLKLGGKSTRHMLARSRWVVLILSAGAIVAALLGSQEIFSSVLFAWTAMGAAFGPALVVKALGYGVSPRRTLLAMLVGFSFAVAAYYLFPASQDKWIERVLPFLAGLLVIFFPPRPTQQS